MANLKRNTIDLVTGFEADEIVTQTYYTPKFLSMEVLYEALDLHERMTENKDKMSEKEMLNEIANFVANQIYEKQFTPEELIKGLHAPQSSEILYQQIIFVTQGNQTAAGKKLMAKKG